MTPDEYKNNLPLPDDIINYLLGISDKPLPSPMSALVEGYLANGGDRFLLAKTIDDENYDGRFLATRRGGLKVIGYDS
jgi:hypothetical protein